MVRHGTIEVWAMGTEGENSATSSRSSRRPTPSDVKVTAIPWEAAHDKFTTAIARETPDVAMVGTTWMGEFAELGGLDPTPEGCRQVRLLPRRVGLDRGRRHVVRRSLVRRDAGGLLPQGPGQKAGCTSPRPTGTG